MNCFCMKKWWALKPTHPKLDLKIETLDFLKWNSEMTDCFSKSVYFQKPRITVTGSSGWQVSVISIFWVTWGKAVQTPEYKKDCTLFLKWVFIGKFSWQAKVPWFRVVFHLANFSDLTNVSVQVILFPLNLVLRASLTFLAWKVKEPFGRWWFCWFSFCMAHLTYCLSDGCWFVWSFSRIFPIERHHPTDKT